MSIHSFEIKTSRYPMDQKDSDSLQNLCFNFLSHSVIMLSKMPCILQRSSHYHCSQWFSNLTIKTLNRLHMIVWPIIIREKVKKLSTKCQNEESISDVNCICTRRIPLFFLSKWGRGCV